MAKSEYVERLAVGLVALSMTALVNPAVAQAYEPGCVQQYWLYVLRGTTRTICDGPIQPDGSWTRARGFYASERYVPMSCSRYSCTGGYWLQEFDKRDTYIVTPTTVLPDEPGHINEGVKP